MKPLPIPLRGGSIKELGNFLNVKSHHDFVLVAAFLLAALRPRGPYPVIALSGEQGSALLAAMDFRHALSAVHWWQLRGTRTLHQSR